jgi:hypothetical protein
VISVSPGDSGSSYDEKTGESGSLGLPATPENCADSVDNRKPSNEWIVRDYAPAGIYILPPIIVRQLGELNGEAVSGEGELNLAQAITPFPDQSIYSANEDSFLRFDRATGKWKPVRYDDIIPPNPVEPKE